MRLKFPRFISTLLFPPEPRQFIGQRWSNIVLRTAHLVGVAGIGGGFLHNLDEPQWMPFWYLTLISGLGLSLLYLAASVVWLFQLRGTTVVVKLILIASAIYWPQLRETAFIAVIILSSVIAHAPGKVRARGLRSVNKSDSYIHN